MEGAGGEGGDNHKGVAVADKDKDKDNNSEHDWDWDTNEIKYILTSPDLALTRFDGAFALGISFNYDSLSVESRQAEVAAKNCK